MRRPLAALIFLLFSPSEVDAIPYRAVAVSGDAATGFDGQVFESLSAARINNSGVVAFSGNVSGGAEFGADGIWMEGAGADDSFRLVVAQGSPQPDAPEMSFGLNDWGDRFDFTDSEKVVFNASAHPTTSLGFGVFSHSEGVTSTISRLGLEAPGSPGMVIDDLYNQSFATAGNGVTFYSGDIENVEGSRSDEVIWVYDGASSETVWRRSDGAPTAPNSTISAIGKFETNRVGDLSVMINYWLPGPDRRSPIREGALILQRDGDWEEIVKIGDFAPGATGAFFGSLNHFHFLNAQGQVAFPSYIYGEGVTEGSNQGIWVGNQYEMNLVVRLGDEAPGLEGVSFADSPLSATFPLSLTDFDDNGNATFFATLDGEEVTRENLGSVWHWSDEALRLVARQGDLAPGTGYPFIRVVGGLMNNAGQVVVQGLSGPAWNDPLNRFGIWATSPEGQLRLIVKEGDVINVRSSTHSTTQKIVETVSDAGWRDPWSTATKFNDSGELVVTLGFTDGTDGVFVFDTAIPEPSTGCLWALLLFFATSNRGLRPHP
ncbi:MAG: choice-of-anchor tandem repeat NxxGxxAF-containing protein [Planctomycetota bacterium]